MNSNFTNNCVACLYKIMFHTKIPQLISKEIMKDITRNMRTLKLCLRRNIVTTGFIYACERIIIVAICLSNR